MFLIDHTVFNYKLKLDTIYILKKKIKFISDLLAALTMHGSKIYKTFNFLKTPLISLLIHIKVELPHSQSSLLGLCILHLTSPG